MGWYDSQGVAKFSIGSVQLSDVGAYDVLVGLDGFEPFSCPETIRESAVLNFFPAVPGDTDGDGDFDLADISFLFVKDRFTGPLP